MAGEETGIGRFLKLLLLLVAAVAAALFYLLGLAACAAGPEEGEGGGRAAADPWALERPASNPRGEAVRLGFRLEPGRVHRYRILMENTLVSPRLMSNRSEYTLRIEPGRPAEGSVPFRASFEVKSRREGGRDVLDRIPPPQRTGAASGLLDARGRLDLESFRVGGSTPAVNRRIRARLAALVLLYPEEPVRLGQAWPVSLEKLRRIMGDPGEGGTFSGQAYQFFEGMERRDGVGCARVRFLFSLRKSGPTLAELGGRPGEIRGRGEITYWYAPEGYVKEAHGRTVSRIEGKGPGGVELVSTQNGEVALQGALAGAGRKEGGPFKVRFETGKGDFLVAFHPANAPRGVKRVRELVAAGFYDGCAFFRVIPGFVVQFGINGDPAENRRWRDRRIADDPVRLSNLAGTVAFAMDGPGSRTTQLFINLVDNPRLDRLGFAPLGKVVEGMEVVRRLYGGYGDARSREGNGPEQEKIEELGNGYLKTGFPRLDYIERAVIVEE